MKFLFIVLTCTDKSFTYNQEWINIGYLVSAISDIKGLDVDVRFCMLDETEKLLEELRGEMPDYIGMPVLQYNALMVMELTRKIKNISNSVKIILGNKEVTLKPDYFMNTVKEIDFVIIGEGEVTLRELVENLMSGGDINDCKGIYYRKGLDIYKTEERQLIQDLNSLKFPNKDFYPYQLSDHKLMCSRGCQGRCTFCAYDVNKEVRSRSIQNIIDEIIHDQKTYGGKYFDIHDSTFCAGNNVVEYLKEFHDAIVNNNLKIRFMFNMRCEQINEETTSILQELSKQGLIFIFIGIESGNANDLKLFGKKATTADNYKAIKLLRNANIDFSYGFIMFTPFSTFETLEQNMNFLLENDLYFNANIIASRIILYTGTPIVRLLEKAGLYTGNTDEPIFDGFNYRFKDQRIEQIWNNIKEVSDELDKLVPQYVYEETLQFIKEIKFEMVSMSERLEDLLFEYRKMHMKYSYELFMNALWQCDKSREYIGFDKENYLKTALELYESIKLEKYRLVKHCYRAGINSVSFS
jgi:anaerobic magnesium-protoporphyrin IX monomethyl ester cyclase